MFDREISMTTKRGVYIPGNVILFNDTKYIVVRVISNGCTDTVELQEITAFVMDRHYIPDKPLTDLRSMTISEYVSELVDSFEKHIPIESIGGEQR